MKGKENENPRICQVNKFRGLRGDRERIRTAGLPLRSDTLTILSFTDFYGTVLGKALFYGYFERLKFNFIWIHTESKGRVLNSFLAFYWQSGFSENSQPTNKASKS